jgi:hypothetical protein
MPLPSIPIRSTGSLPFASPVGPPGVTDSIPRRPGSYSAVTGLMLADRRTGQPLWTASGGRRWSIFW